MSDEPSVVILLRIEKLIQKQIEQTAALHSDIHHLLAAMVRKISNGTTEHEGDSNVADG